MSLKCYRPQMRSGNLRFSDRRRSLEKFGLGDRWVGSGYWVKSVKSGYWVGSVKSGEDAIAYCNFR